MQTGRVGPDHARKEATLDILRADPVTHRMDQITVATGPGHRLFRAIPKGEPPADGWPVLYLLDGNAAFDFLTADHLAMVPGLMLVGVGYDTERQFARERRTLDFTAPDGPGDGIRPDPVHPGRMAGGAAQFLDRLVGPLRDAAEAGLPISLTKPLGVGVLNNKHKSTGEVFPQAIEVMTTLNRDASIAAVAAGVKAATDVTGFGLLGHLWKMMRASGVAAEIDAAAVPYIDGAREAARDGYVSGGTRRNLDWVAPHIESEVDENELLLLADAQTSGGLLVIGEVPGAPIIGRTVKGEPGIRVR